MGTTLIKAFTKQLEGRLEVSGPTGTTTTVHFNVSPMALENSMAPRPMPAVAR